MVITAQQVPIDLVKPSTLVFSEDQRKLIDSVIQWNAGTLHEIFAPAEESIGRLKQFIQNQLTIGGTVAGVIEDDWSELYYLSVDTQKELIVYRNHFLRLTGNLIGESPERQFPCSPQNLPNFLEVLSTAITYHQNRNAYEKTSVDYLSKPFESILGSGQIAVNQIHRDIDTFLLRAPTTISNQPLVSILTQQLEQFNKRVNLFQYMDNHAYEVSRRWNERWNIALSLILIRDESAFVDKFLSLRILPS